MPQSRTGGPEGYETHRLLTPRWEAAERRRLTQWGLPDKRMKPLRVWLNPDHGPALDALPFDLVWATTWEEEANAYVAPVLGLPELPFIAWSSPRPVPGGGLFWKTPEIVTWANLPTGELTGTRSTWGDASRSCQGWPASFSDVGPQVGTLSLAATRRHGMPAP
ncbi:hypothetical protein [Streptomyces agglomeratus]|uniref:hypothetical protein n=1 Tax=Streptomyces agglomeratus TaxID=285458 RepID=UPI003F732E37